MLSGLVPAEVDGGPLRTVGAGVAAWGVRLGRHPHGHHARRYVLRHDGASADVRTCAQGHAADDDGAGGDDDVVLEDRRCQERVIADGDLLVEEAVGTDFCAGVDDDAVGVGEDAFGRISEQAMGTPWIPRNPRKIAGPAEVREILALAA